MYHILVHDNKYGVMHTLKPLNCDYEIIFYRFIFIKICAVMYSTLLYVFDGVLIKIIAIFLLYII
jgi:hypothetical protein